MKIDSEKSSKSAEILIAFISQGFKRLPDSGFVEHFETK